MRAGDHLLLERIGASVADGLKPIERHHREHLDELAVPVGVLGQPLAQPRHCGGQVPVLERRPVAQRPGLALQDCYVVPGVVDRAALSEAAGMLADELPGTQHDRQGPEIAACCAGELDAGVVGGSPGIDPLLTR